MKTIDDLLKENHALPSLPAIMVELQNCLGKENTGAKLLSEKISRDQALSAKTLRLANSPFYSLQCTVSTLKQAVAVLGFDSVRTMVTTAAVVNAFSTSRLPPEFNFEDFWRHSLATGLCAKALARFYDVDPDEAFLTGLLHDIGKLVLARAHPQQYARAIEHAREHQCAAYVAEQSIFGFDHAAVGTRLAKQWNFPVAIQQAIRKHESPLTSMDTSGLVTLIHVANTVVINFGLADKDLDDVAEQSLSASLLNGPEDMDGILFQAAKDTKARINEVYNSLLTH